MRISDWSSDVCSSDLGCAHDDADRTARKQAVRQEEVRSASSSCRTMPRAPWAKHGCALGQAAVQMQGLEDVRASALLATLSDQYPGLGLTTTGTRPTMAKSKFFRIAVEGATVDVRIIQIGRASCRERVCQYV